MDAETYNDLFIRNYDTLLRYAAWFVKGMNTCYGCDKYDLLHETYHARIENVGDTSPFSDDKHFVCVFVGFMRGKVADIARAFTAQKRGSGKVRAFSYRHDGCRDDAAIDMFEVDFPGSDDTTSVAGVGMSVVDREIYCEELLAAAKMSDADRSVLMARLQGMTYSECSDAVGVSVEAARNANRRAVKALRAVANHEPATA
ncbi:RNA polymerase sigma factor [Rosistilla oblonga]|uniref:RNA polymerase sigma factor n=1 Tax=Rosistilla oblonga TaxID=2527990 RepID=UPI003A975E86